MLKRIIVNEKIKKQKLNKLPKNIRNIYFELLNGKTIKQLALEHEWSLIFTSLAILRCQGLIEYFGIIAFPTQNIIIKIN